MNALIIIHRNSLECYYSDRDNHTTCMLPLSAIADMEVVNEQEFAKIIAGSFGSAPVRPIVPTIIAVGDDVCFALNFTPEQETQAANKMVDIVPFSHVATTIVRSTSSTALVATNQDLYETTVRIFQTHGYATILVLPWSAITLSGISGNGVSDKNTVRRVFDALPTLKKTSFSLYSEHIELTEHTITPQTQQVRKIAWGWIIFGFGALVYAVIMIVRIIR